MTRRSFAVFDVDGTLHGGALGAQFIMALSRHGYTKNPIHELHDQWLAAPDKTAFFMEYFYPEFETLQPITRTEMQTIGQKLAEETAKTIRPKLQERIDWHRTHGHALLIISTSPSVTIEPLARLLHFDDYSTPPTPFNERGLYTGPAHRTPEQKDKSLQLKQLIDKHALDPSLSWAYGDTLDDLPMLEYVTHAIAVTPTLDLQTIATERGWEIINE